MSLRASLAFFTRLPVGAPSAPASFQDIFAWLPLVGILIGLLVALTVWLSLFFLPASLCGLLGCLCWVAVTGGLHTDGVADCGDGLLPEASAQRRLEIMKDSRLGAFGAVALFFVLACKLVTLQILAQACRPDLAGLFALCAASALAAGLARCFAFIPNRMPTARPDGLGKRVSQSVTPRQELAALVVSLALVCLNGVRGIVALVLALAVTWLFLRAARQRLGGVTGDVYGCLIELVECAVLCACCLDIA